MPKNGTPEDHKRWCAAYYQTHKKEAAEWSKKYNRTNKGRFVHLKNKAQQKGIEVTLTESEYISLRDLNKCNYCSSPLNETGYAIDRLDHRLGYILVNCVPCCASCNQRKGGLELAGFVYPRTVELMMELLSK